MAYSFTLFLELSCSHLLSLNANNSSVNQEGLYTVFSPRYDCLKRTEIKKKWLLNQFKQYHEYTFKEVNRTAERRRVNKYDFHCCRHLICVKEQSDAVDPSVRNENSSSILPQMI
ncbi:uncharacterized protein WM294_005792 [Sarcoramphus papa]